MTDDPRLRSLANATAEEILRTIYGDDFSGCTVHPDTIASLVYAALAGRLAADRELLELYEKAHEALELLATPPPGAHALAPPELQSLLGSRLDTIRNLAQKLRSTAEKVNTGGAAGGGESV